MLRYFSKNPDLNNDVLLDSTWGQLGASECDVENQPPEAGHVAVLEMEVYLFSPYSPG